MRPDFAAMAPMRRQRFLRHPEQVAAARQFVTEPLVRGSEVRETARLLVSEIVTSQLDRMPSILGAGSFEVAYAMVDGWIRVEVRSSPTADVASGWSRRWRAGGASARAPAGGRSGSSWVRHRRTPARVRPAVDDGGRTPDRERHQVGAGRL